jgi:hypothetical protein
VHGREQAQSRETIALQRNSKGHTNKTRYRIEANSDGRYGVKERDEN